MCLSWQVGYGFLLLTSGQGLLSDAFAGSFTRPVVLDVFIFVVSAFFLKQTVAKVSNYWLAYFLRKSAARVSRARTYGQVGTM